MTDNLITSSSEPLQKAPKRSKFSQDSIFFNLNDYVKDRLLVDMLKQKVLPNCRESSNYLIMVLDDFAAKNISNYCNTFELMDAANIY